MSRISRSKLPGVGTTIFTVMSDLAAQYNAVNLGQGFPDFPIDPLLTEYVNEAMRENKNQYTHMFGYPILRERLADDFNKRYNSEIHPDHITITPGATYGIYTAFTSFIFPGDEVIMFTPAYDSYRPNIEINGGVVIEIPLTYPDYSIDWNVVRKRINPKTRAIIINSPHNPTGTMMSDQDMQELIALTQNTDILIISDEVYEHVVYDNKQHISVLQYEPLRERSFVVYSFGKTLSCTGWKLGYVVAPPDLMKEFRKVHQFNVFTCNTPMQAGIATYLEKSTNHLQLKNTLQAKRDLLQSLFQGSGFEPLPSVGSYFQLYRYDKISNKPDNEFAVELVKNAGVVTIPVSAFYGDAPPHRVLRFCFSKRDEVLEEAAKRLLQFV